MSTCPTPVSTAILSRAAVELSTGIKHAPRAGLSKRAQLVAYVYGWNSVLNTAIAATGLPTRRALNHLYSAHFQK